MCRETELYCQYDETKEPMLKFKYFFTNSFGVEMCGATKEQVKKVIVREVSKELKGETYYAWWSNEDSKFHFVFPTYSQILMCFPYDIKGYIDRGVGLVLPVEIIIKE